MRGIDKLIPPVEALAKRFLSLCEEAGYLVKITDTLRTEAEQNAIPAANTNARYPNSYHNWGLAFDFCRDVKGREWDNSDKFFNAVGAIGKSIGLTWGGDFKSIKDMPHLQDDTHGNIKALISRWGTPELFLKSW
jgi:peptidoglycan L-alanyl-D-glutamate endopeptidase CwlK